MSIRHLAAPIVAALALGTASPEVKAAEPKDTITVGMPQPANALEERVGPPIQSKTVLEIKLIDKGLVNGKVQLEGGAYMEVEEDGKMRFKNAGFEAYAMLTYHNNFIVYDERGHPLLTIGNKGGNIVTTYMEGLDARQMELARKAAPLICGCS